MKNLFLIRHSKSSWNTTVQDINRSISKIGVKDAHLIASKTVALLPKSYIVWSSMLNELKKPLLFFRNIYRYL